MNKLRQRLADWLWPDYKVLAERNQDLYAELMAHTKHAIVITPDQLKDIERTKTEHTRLVKEQEQIVLYLRDVLPGFVEGRYGYLSFPELVIKLMRGALVPAPGSESRGN